MPICRWYESQSKTHGAYRVFKTQGKRGNEGKLKRPPHHDDTGVTTRRLTGGKISSPSQPYYGNDKKLTSLIQTLKIKC